jgi:hypothetical protein
MAAKNAKRKKKKAPTFAYEDGRGVRHDPVSRVELARLFHTRVINADSKLWLANAAAADGTHKTLALLPALYEFVIARVPVVAAAVATLAPAAAAATPPPQIDEDSGNEAVVVEGDSVADADTGGLDAAVEMAEIQLLIDQAAADEAAAADNNSGAKTEMSNAAKIAAALLNFNSDDDDDDDSDISKVILDDGDVAAAAVKTSGARADAAASSLVQLTLDMERDIDSATAGA